MFHLSDTVKFHFLTKILLNSKRVQTPIIPRVRSSSSSRAVASSVLLSVVTVAEAEVRENSELRSNREELPTMKHVNHVKYRNNPKFSDK